MATSVRRREGRKSALGSLAAGCLFLASLLFPPRAAAANPAAEMAAIFAGWPHPALPVLWLSLASAGHVAGRLVDSAGRPIAGAGLEAQVEGSDDSWQTESDEDGYFVIAAPGMEGPIDLHAVHSEYGESSLTARASRGVFPEQTSIFTLLRRRQGRVIDREGRPVPVARLALRPSHETDEITAEIYVPPHFWTETDAQGQFTLEDLPRGNQMLLFVQAADFVPALVPLPEEETPFEIVLERGAFVGGIVYDGGRPAVGAYVEMKPAGAPGGPGVIADTDTDGHFRLGPVKPGRRLVVAADFFSHSGGEEIEVPPEGLEGLQLQLEKAVTLAGIVRDPAGLPLEGARIRIQLPEHVERSAGSSGSGGRFEVHDLPEARVLLRVGHPDFGSIEQEVELAAGMEPIDIFLAPASPVDLLVSVSARSEEIEGAKVSARDLRFPKRFIERVTDGRGQTRLELLPPGRYRLEVVHPQHPPFSSEISVSAEGPHEFQVRLGPGGRIHGWLGALAPRDLARLELIVHDDSGAGQAAIELDRQTGEFAIQGLAAGWWNLRFALGPYQAITRRVEVGTEPIFLEVDWQGH